jgi:hypothetical protein
MHGHMSRCMVTCHDARSHELEKNALYVSTFVFMCCVLSCKDTEISRTHSSKNFYENISREDSHICTKLLHRSCPFSDVKATHGVFGYRTIVRLLCKLTVETCRLGSDRQSYSQTPGPMFENSHACRMETVKGTTHSAYSDVNKTLAFR